MTCSLCSHHGTGKKVLFAEFARQFGDEIKEAADSYLNEFDGAFYKWVNEAIYPRVAEEIVSDWEEVLGVARMAKQMLSGEEITIGDGELPSKTQCEGAPDLIDIHLIR